MIDGAEYARRVAEEQEQALARSRALAALCIAGRCKYAAHYARSADGTCPAEPPLQLSGFERCAGWIASRVLRDGVLRVGWGPCDRQAAWWAAEKKRKAAGRSKAPRKRAAPEPWEE